MTTLQTSLKYKQTMNLIPKFTADEGLDEDTSLENSISDDNSQAASGRDDQDGLKKTNTSGAKGASNESDQKVSNSGSKQKKKTKY